MGNKRKLREEEEARITEKIKKLERKLKRRRRRIISDSDSEIEDQILPVLTPSSSPASALGASPLNQGGISLDIPSLVSPIRDTSSCEQFTSLDPVSVGAVTQDLPEPGTSAPNPAPTNEQMEETPLEEDILQILGEAPQPDITLGKNIHKDIASRWQDILLKGLTKEVKEPLLKKYAIPANCNLLVSPILNPEAKAALPDILAKRDLTLSHKQNQIGVALAALSQLTDMILRNETSKTVLMQPLSDACRILCDSHNVETKTRRSIIMSSINTTLRDTLQNASRDKYLFGEDLAEKLKAAKSVQKTGESLQKPNSIPSSSNNSNFKGMPRNKNLNSRGPIQRKPPNRTSETPRGTPAGKTRSTTYSRQPPPPPKRSSQTRRNYRQ